MMSDTTTHLPDSAITDRPWRGTCATTGLTMDDYRERLAGTVADLPPAVLRAAVSIARSYGIKGWSDPGYIANVIGGELARAGVIPCTTEGHDHGGQCGEGERYTSCLNCERVLFWDPTGSSWVHLRESAADVRPDYRRCLNGGTARPAVAQ